MSAPLTKVDSAVQGLEEPAKESRVKKADTSGVYNINDLGMHRLLVDLSLWLYQLLTICAEAQGIELQIAKETQKTGW
jgi:hypothetical protein